MTEQEHYSLRWNNHQNHILRAFDALLQTKSLVDVTLVCAETSIHAHKVVLSACSPFFQNVFAENPCKHPVIVLKDYPGWVVQAVVDFMYRGEISVPQKRLETLIQVGESLQIRGLVEQRAATENLQLTLDIAASSTDDYLERSLLSVDSVGDAFDEDANQQLIKTTLAAPQNGTKHSLKSNTVNNEREQNERTASATPVALNNNNKNNNNNTSASTTTNHYTHPNEINRETNCTSPMPRRKQARPRRRSGECGPHDFSSSKPSSPIPNDDHVDQLPNKQSTNEKDLHLQQQQQHHHHHHHVDDVIAEQRKFNERIGASLVCRTDLDTDKVVDCTVAAMEQSIIRNKLNQSKDEISDNEMDDDDEDGNDMNVHNLHGDDMEGEDDEMDVNENEHDEDKMEARNLRKRPRQYLCDDDDDDDEEEEEEEDDMSSPENDDLDDGDGPENLCIKNNRNSNERNAGNTKHNSNNNSSSSNNNKDTNSKNCSSNNNNRIGLSLKDIRHLNRPQSHCRQSLFAAFPPHHPVHNQQQPQKDEHLSPSSAAAAAAAAAAVAVQRNEQMQKLDLSRQSQSHQMPTTGQPNNSQQQQAFLESQAENLKREAIESRLESENAYMDQVDLQLAAAAAAYHNATGLHHPNSRHPDSENNLHKDFTPSSPMSLQSHFNPREGPPHPPSPLQFPGMSSALTLTPPHHMFGLDSPLSLFPPGMDPGKLYNPLMEMSDPRSMHPHPHGPYLKKKNKLSRPKGQHSAPRGGPPRSWTNAELTEALHHVWNKKMTTSQASRLFGIPYNSLLMYVRGKYGKSLNLEQLRKGCISGPPIELLTMGLGAHSNNNGAPSKSGSGSNRSSKEIKESEENHRHEREGGGGGGGGGGGRASGSSSLKRSTSSEPDLLSNPNAMFNPFPPGFYSDFAAGFPGLPLSMLNLLPPERHPPSMHGMQIDEDCKSDRSKQSLEDDYPLSQPLALNRNDRRELIQQNGQD